MPFKITQSRPIGQSTGIDLYLMVSNTTDILVKELVSLTSNPTSRSRAPVNHLSMVIATLGYARVTTVTSDREVIINNIFGRLIPPWLAFLPLTLPERGRLNLHGYACRYKFTDNDVNNIMHYVDIGGFRNSLDEIERWLNYGAIRGVSADEDVISGPSKSFLDTFVYIPFCDGSSNWSHHDEPDDIESWNSIPFFHRCEGHTNFTWIREGLEPKDVKPIPRDETIFQHIQLKDMDTFTVYTKSPDLNANSQWLSIMAYGHFSFLTDTNREWYLRYCSKFEQQPRLDELTAVTTDAVITVIVSSPIQENQGKNDKPEDGGRRDVFREKQYEPADRMIPGKNEPAENVPARRSLDVNKSKKKPFRKPKQKPNPKELGNGQNFGNERQNGNE